MLHRAWTAAHSRIVNAWPVRQALGRMTAPLATITFDDFPRNAWTTGAKVLDEFGVRATYFVSGGFAPENLARMPPGGMMQGVQYFEPDDLVQAHEQGHEIGCHTFEHRNAPTLSDDELLRSVQRNAEFVRGLLGDVVMTSFAFPQGRADIRTKRLMSRHFTVCRGTWPGINSGIFDLSLLRCVGLDPMSMRRFPLDRLIEETRRRNGWLILNGHDVADAHTQWGCSPQTLRETVAALTAAGIEVLPLKNALARVVFR